MSGMADGSSPAGRKHPGGGGKKGRRRKGHKKKIKRIKPSDGDDGDSLIAPENDPSAVMAAATGSGGQRGDSGTGDVTKLSLSESEQKQQSQKPGRKKHRQKLAPEQLAKTAMTGKKRPAPERGQKSPRKGHSGDGNWDRRAGRELVVLNSDDIYDKNMQITAPSDGRQKVVVNLPSVTDAGSSSDSSSSSGSSWWGQPEETNQRDLLQRKLTPVERKLLLRQQKMAEKQQRKQLKKFRNGK